MKTILLWLAVTAGSSTAAPIAVSVKHAAYNPTESHAVIRDQIAVITEKALRDEVQMELGEQRHAAVMSRLRRASDLLDQGFAIASVRPLSQASLAVERSFHTNVNTALTDLESLQTEVESFLAEFRAESSPLEGMTQRTTELQALMEAHYAQAMDYGVAAPVQGSEGSLRAGQFYYSRAKAHASVVRWLRSLDSEASSSTQPNLGGVEEYLNRLERELLDIYEPPLSEERHSDFIQISAALKFARELFAKGFAAGAFTEGLDGARLLSILLDDLNDTPSPTAQEVETLLAQYRSKLEGLAVDTSLPESYALEAERLLASGTDDLLSVKVMIERVIGDCIDCFQNPSPESKTQALPDVVITLVRWPFT